MSCIQIKNPYGAILGMDMMCDGTIPPDLRAGDAVVHTAPDGQSATLTVVTLDAHRTESGDLSAIVGIGLRGERASLVQPGDELILAPQPTHEKPGADDSA